MNVFLLRKMPALILLLSLAGCANVVPPSGGKKDVTPPKMLSVSPADSLLNTRVTEIEMRFNEFINLNNPSKEIQISPLLPFPLTTTLSGKKLTIQIPDSLLNDSTTYRISFGSAVRDLNENNELKNLNYIFSTGDYFDSLMLFGKVMHAATGSPATDVDILLYYADLPDSAIVKRKPSYVTKVQSGGVFILPGLPEKKFRIYALKDANDNLVYDGDDEEIAFVDSVLLPVDTAGELLTLRLFKEIPPLDTLKDEDSTDTASKDKFGRGRKARDSKDDEILRYTIAVDTTDTIKRTHDLNKPLKITFSNAIDTYDMARVQLSYRIDSTKEQDVDILVKRDTLPNVLFLESDWQPNQLYTIKVFKDFATDTTELKSGPSKYVFRTLSVDDYGIININLPEEHYGPGNILVVKTEKDTVYNEPVTDSSVRIERLLPASYNIFIIKDENRNGKWDTGDLFAKIQPEYVVPYAEPIELRAGWENVIDFVVPVNEPDTTNKKPSPEKRDKPAGK